MIKKYNGLFIFSAALKDEDIDKTIESAKKEIEQAGGKVESAENLGRKTFIAPMHKQDSGIYVMIKFDIDAAKCNEVRTRFRHNESVFRTQFTVRDLAKEAALEVDKNRRAAHRAKLDAEAAAAEAAAAAKLAATVAASAAAAPAPAPVAAPAAEEAPKA